MKPQETKLEFIKLRAEGKSYNFIADKLNLSTATCKKWGCKLSEEIAQLKKEELETLYESYHMTKEAKIKQIGNTLKRIEEALAETDLTEIPPEKLLDYKLRYTEALQKEYIPTSTAYNIKDSSDPKEILKAFTDLLNRVRSGELTTEQANRESVVLNNLLKAFETVEVKDKLNEIEKIIEGK